MNLRVQRGFTLIELMIVIVVISILSAIAIPAYNDYVLKSKLTEAFTELSTMRVRMEQYFQDNRSYVNACNANTVATPPTGTYFDITCDPAPNDTAFTVVAAGKASQGLSGFRYTINQSNVRASTTPWGDNASCWVRTKGGAC